MSRDIEEEEIEIARDQLEINTNPAAVCEFIAKCMSTCLTTKQLAYQWKKCEQEVAEMLSNEGGSCSAADKLMSFFKPHGNISYVCINDDDADDSTNLITIPK